MTKVINIKIVSTKEILPQDVRLQLEREIEDGKFDLKGFKNNFEVIEYVNCGNLIGRFLCSYRGEFFTIPINHVVKALGAG